LVLVAILKAVYHCTEGFADRKRVQVGSVIEGPSSKICSEREHHPRNAEVDDHLYLGSIHDDECDNFMS
jgi:hypothetical protein